MTQGLSQRCGYRISQTFCDGRAKRATRAAQSAATYLSNLTRPNLLQAILHAARQGGDGPCEQIIVHPQTPAELIIPHNQHAFSVHDSEGLKSALTKPSSGSTALQERFHQSDFREYRAPCKKLSAST